MTQVSRDSRVVDSSVVRETEREGGGEPQLEFTITVRVPLVEVIGLITGTDLEIFTPRTVIPKLWHMLSCIPETNSILIDR